MAKKHFICTHTWVSPEARVEFLKMTSDITDREFFESVKTERAETLRHWMGKEDLMDKTVLSLWVSGLMV